jgi:hypothetical protein
VEHPLKKQSFQEGHNTKKPLGIAGESEEQVLTAAREHKPKILLTEG